MAKSKRVFFIVEGSGTFPFDMLRYDHAWPYSESKDSPSLDRDLRWGVRRVMLSSDTPQAPTDGRWRSFGWQVIAIGHDDIAIDNMREVETDILVGRRR
jgi:hypothetical protein